jgi:hypothetical protein
MSTELSQDRVYLQALQSEIGQSERSRQTRDIMSTELSQDRVYLQALQSETPERHELVIVFSRFSLNETTKTTE